MIKEEGLTSGQKAFLGVLTPAVFFLPVVLILAMFQSDAGLGDMIMAGFEQPIIQLFWGLVLVSLLAIAGFLYATVRRRKADSRRGRFQEHVY